MATFVTSGLSVTETASGGGGFEDSKTENLSDKNGTGCSEDENQRKLSANGAGCRS